MTTTRLVKRVYVVLVNWNGWRDTISCLESVFRSDYDNFRVVVCDNASQDESLERISSWAKGKQPIAAPSEPRLQPLVTPPVPKPISHVTIKQAQAAQIESNDAQDIPLVLIDTGGNLGFAGGSNVGIRYALSCGDCALVWCLNNDTVVATDAMSALVSRLEKKPSAGLCGSTIAFINRPEYVQAFGGCRYFPFAGMSMSVGRVFGRLRPISPEKIEPQIDYIMGASMMATKSFLDEVGLLCEDFFLYYEELDWALRAKPRFDLAYAPQSLVFHKAGGTAGSSRHSRMRSTLSDFYLNRNALLITQRYFRVWTASVRAFILFRSLHRLLSGRPLQAQILWKVALSQCVTDLSAP